MSMKSTNKQGLQNNTNSSHSGQPTHGTFIKTPLIDVLPTIILFSHPQDARSLLRLNKASSMTIKPLDLMWGEAYWRLSRHLVQIVHIQPHTLISPHQRQKVEAIMNAQQLRSADNCWNWAARKGHVPVIQRLLRERSLDQLNSALGTAARLGYLELAGVLLEAGADIHTEAAVRQRRDKRLTPYPALDVVHPLRAAVMGGHVEVARLLLAKGAFLGVLPMLTLKDVIGNALKAQKSGASLEPDAVKWMKMIDVLIDAGITGRNWALLDAIRLPTAHVVHRLLQDDFDINMHHKNLALRGAASAGRLIMVSLLVDAGADVNADGGSAGPPLIAAISATCQCWERHRLRDAAAVVENQEGWLEDYDRGLNVIGFLLEEEADIHYNSEQALRMAIHSGCSDIVSCLLEHGADIHISKDYPLMVACGEGHTEVGLLLLAAGANVNAVGGVAYVMGALRDDVGVARVLMKRDGGETEGGISSKEIFCTGGLSSIATIPDIGDDEAVQVVLIGGANTRGQDLAAAITAAADCGYVNGVRKLLHEGASVEGYGTLRDRPLAVAAREGHADVVTMLLKAGAYMRAHNCAALRYAREHHHFHIVDLLMKDSTDEGEGEGITSNSGGKWWSQLCMA
ncbi:hypothetical protein HDV00_011745 [Rhizophlyctis rosea]|nr:hypothetical protein HDV00_011745 [Rhizophlyctis rosea]